MEWYWALSLLMGGVLLLMMLGTPVAFAFLGVNVVGALVFLGGEAGLVQLARNAVNAVASFSLAPIAMFVLMGEILFQTHLAHRAIDAVDRLILRVPGRLALVAVGGGTVFSTLSGSTMANTALLGSTLLPEMRRRGYHPTIAMGPIMATGGIAMLIPPSALAVLLGSLAGISIGKLLVAGVVPGLLMAALCVGYVLLRCGMNPALAPTQQVEPLPLRERLRPFLIYVVPLFGLFVIVVGGILTGLATPSESAALGAMGALAAAALYRRLTLDALRRALMETTKITVTILLIIAGSLTFSQILAFSGATSGLIGAVEALNLDSLVLLLAMIGILLMLGAFMDQLSMLLITLPFFMPMAAAAGFEPIWFGVILLLVMEISLTTPPFGLLLFVMKGVAPPDTTMRQVYLAAAPFVGLSLLLLTAVVFMPWLATGLLDLGGG
ncbi:MAG: TRAP transporter large permease [Alphaproteobacteria bacterium]|nr:TRAP transporter large permease [Alphaproteobacteria bacterium]